MHTIVIKALDPVYTEFLNLTIESVVIEVDGQRHDVFCAFTQDTNPEHESIFEVELSAEFAGLTEEVVEAAPVVDIILVPWPNVGFPAVSFRDLEVQVSVDGQVLS
jgi:hypothetical protein